MGLFYKFKRIIKQMAGQKNSLVEAISTNRIKIKDIVTNDQGGLSNYIGARVSGSLR
jgi:hypothetical protein